MTTGTTGNDILTNDPTVFDEIVDALAGDDVITIRRPQAGQGPTIRVLGGEGIYTLIIQGGQIQGSVGSEANRTIGIREGSNANYRVEYSSIERLQLSGSLFGRDVSLITGESVDILRLSAFSPSTVTGATIATNGGNDEIYFSIADAGAVTIDGGAGDDRIDFSGTTGGGSRTGFGGDGSDFLTGSGLADTLNGGADDDILDGGAGADTLIGGAGSDVYVVDDAGDVVIEDGSPGENSIVTTLASYALPAANFENLFGRNAAGQVLTGNAINNRVEGWTGNDTLDGGAGADVIDGGDGIDTVDYSQGGSMSSVAVNLDTQASLFTQLGNFLVGPGEAQDQYGGATDTLFGLENVRTGAGADNIRGNSVANVIDAGAGNDRVNGIAGDDTIFGRDGDDILLGEDGADVLDGGAGDDILDVGVLDGIDRAFGGAGFDTASAGFNRSTTAVIMSPDFTRGPDGGYDGRIANADGTLAIEFTSIEQFSFSGTAFDDTLYGAEGADFLSGGAGRDMLTARAGNDLLRGGAGDDVLIGGAGDDIYDVADAGDVVTEEANEGVDVIRTTLVGYSIAGLANIENLWGIGNVSQTLTGNDGANVINGGLGADTMVGGRGDDIYVVDNAGDGVVERANEGTDEVRTSADHTLSANVENLTANATRGLALQGNLQTNVIRGTSFADTITGTPGADQLIGSAGDDTYELNDRANVVVEDAGGGLDTVRTAFVSYTLEANVERLVGINFQAQALTGNGLNNVISGNDGNDTLDGGGGTDTLRGGQGDDTYVVDGSDDIVTELSGEGADTIRTALADYTLPFAVETLVYTGAGNAVLRGNFGDNVLIGGAGNDFFRLEAGGNDRAVGGAGDDGFYFGGGSLGESFSGADRVDGGAGNDQVGLQGRYSVTLGAESLVDIETLVLLPGSDTRFADLGGVRTIYGITTVDANVAAGRTLTVNMNTLRAGEDVVFDGSAETDGTFLFYGGGGLDRLTGGGGSDAFFFGTGKFGAFDTVDGRGGADDQLGLQGDYAGANAVVLGANQLAGIETVVLLTAFDARFGQGNGTGYSYDLTASDGNVVAGGTLTINANTLRANETFAFNGLAEFDGSFQIFGGAGADVITGGLRGDAIAGGAGNDVLRGGGGGDALDGGAGADLFRYDLVQDSTAAGMDSVSAFERGVDRFDLSRIDADANVGGDQAFSFVGAAAFSMKAGELRVGNGVFEGDVDGDGKVDFVVAFATTDGAPLTMGDFVL